jgi:restriction system protein
MSHEWSSDSAFPHEADSAMPPTQALSRELLDALEWRRFEELVTLYFFKTGFVAKRSRVGADGGVDILLYRQGEQQPFAYVQCKAWHTYKVGVKPVRELLGVMAAEKISQGYFVTTGAFTSEALAFAENQSLKLVTGDYLLEKLKSLPPESQDEIMETVTCGDYTTPTCPHCDIKMVMRHGSSGDFWGCLNYSRPWPNRCKQTFKLSDSKAT